MSLMVMKNYPPEFKADAVALVLSRPDRTITSIARDLGVSRETLRVCGYEPPRLGVRAGNQRPAGPGPARTPRPAPYPRTTRWKRRTSSSRRGSGSWSKSGTFCARRPSFSRARQLVNRFQFVEDHKALYGVKRLCRVLRVSRSGFYRWLKAPRRGWPAARPMSSWPSEYDAFMAGMTAPTARLGCALPLVAWRPNRERVGRGSSHAAAL